MNQSKLTKHLPNIGRIFTPAAMLVALTYEIVSHESTPASGGWYYALLAGAAATAVGVEAVGILAGHTFEGYWRIGDRNRTALALLLLVIYTVAGLYILRGNDVLQPIPIIAAVVYIASGLAESLNAQQAHQSKTEDARAELELEELAKEKEFEREMRRQAQADKTAVALAKVEAKTVSSRAVTSRSDSGHFPSDYRLLTAAQKDEIVQLTSGELEQLAGISGSTARRWKRQVAANGYHK